MNRETVRAGYVMMPKITNADEEGAREKLAGDATTWVSKLSQPVSQAMPRSSQYHLPVNPPDPDLTKDYNPSRPSIITPSGSLKTTPSSANYRARRKLLQSLMQQYPAGPLLKNQSLDTTKGTAPTQKEQSFTIRDVRNIIKTAAVLPKNLNPKQEEAAKLQKKPVNTGKSAWTNVFGLDKLRSALAARKGTNLTDKATNSTSVKAGLLND